MIVVWARDTSDGQVKGFLVEKGAAGYEALVIEGKGSVRAVLQADITLTGVRVPMAYVLPGARSFKDAVKGPRLDPHRRRMGSTRPCGGGLRGGAEATPSSAASSEKPLVHFQLVQDQLVKMLAEVTAMQL